MLCVLLPLASKSRWCDARLGKCRIARSSGYRAGLLDTSRGRGRGTWLLHIAVFSLICGFALISTNLLVTYQHWLTSFPCCFLLFWNLLFILCITNNMIIIQIKICEWHIVYLATITCAWSFEEMTENWTEGGNGFFSKIRQPWL